MNASWLQRDSFTDTATMGELFIGPDGVSRRTFSGSEEE